MAIQPIQLPNGMGTAKGMEHFGEALDDYTKFKDQQRTQSRMEEQQKSEMLHRRRMEYGQAFAQAQQYIKAGDLQSAQAVLAPFVNGFETADSPLGQEQQPGAAPPQAHGGSAVPDQVDQGRSVAGGPAAFQPSPPLQQANAYAQLTPSTDDPDVVAAQAGKPKTYRAPYDPLFDPTKDMPPSPPGLGPSDQGTAAPPEEAPTNPIMAARAQERATEQRRAQKLLRYADPFTGQQVTLDPAEAEQSRRDQMARQGGENERVLHQSFDDLVKTDPFVAEQFPRILATYKAAGVPVDPKQVLGELMASQRQAEQDKRFAQQLGFRGEQNDLTRVVRREGIAAGERNSVRAADARRAQATLQNPGGVKEDAGNRGDASNLERAVKDYYGEADSKTMLKSDRLLNGAITNVAAKGPEAVTSHKDAFMGLARYFRGGTPTDSETQLMMKHLGGIKGAVQQYLADVDTGDFSDITIANLTAAAQRAKEESERNIANFTGGLRERLGPGSEFENMGPQVNRHIKSQARLYGISVPDLYPESKGPGVVLGSGTRPAQRPAAPVGGRPQAGRATPAPAADAETIKKLAKDWDAMR